MISLGSSEIKDLRLGSSKIKKAYLGTALVWEKVVVVTTAIIDMPYGGYNMFIYDASNINWHKFDLFKYIVIDGKYKLYRDKDFTVYRDGISLIEGTSFYNIPLRTGMRVDFVFGADYY